jgi:para-nitrobenzyl esterase
VLPQGEVIGSVGRYGNHVWKGLPFAQPPVGELRWRAPLPAGGWEGVREALHDPPACPQRIASRPPLGTEDCLYLNVFAPAFEPGDVPRGHERLPVMVWIHGGGNSVGSAALFEGGRLAQEHRLIVVAVQYRLGPLGWFRHAALRDPDRGARGSLPRADSAEDASGNYGTLDLIQALRWVHQSVSVFGGAPDRVTVFGESAGGRNVYSLLLSPAAGALFQGAIAQSGGLALTTPADGENPVDAAQPGHASSSAEITARLLIAHAGAADRAAALARAQSMPAAELAAFLRARSPHEVLEATRSGRGLGLLEFPQIFGDGVVQPAEEPLESLAARRYHRVPVILGSNRDESKLFMSFDPRYADRRLFLPRVRDWARYERDAEYRSKVWRINAVDAPAALMRAAQGPSVYAYRFDWDDLGRWLWLDLTRLIGAAHGLDVPFVMGHFERRFMWIPLGGGNVRERDALAAQMMSYWAQFAYAGAPGRGRNGALPWDDSSAEAKRFMLLDTASDGGLRMASDALTSAGLVAQMAADPRFADAAERCALIEELARWRPALQPADRAAAGCLGAGGPASE